MLPSDDSASYPTAIRSRQLIIDDRRSFISKPRVSTQQYPENGLECSHALKQTALAKWWTVERGDPVGERPGVDWSAIGKQSRQVGCGKVRSNAVCAG